MCVNLCTCRSRWQTRSRAGIRRHVPHVLVTMAIGWWREGFWQSPEPPPNTIVSSGSEEALLIFAEAAAADNRLYADKLMLR